MPVRNTVYAATAAVLVAAALVLVWPAVGLATDWKPKTDRLPKTATQLSRPELARLKLIVARHPHDIAAITKEIAGLNRRQRTRNFCVVRQNDIVRCVNLEKLVKGELPQRADQNLIGMALDDLLDVLGGSASADTLLACSSANGIGFTDLFAVPNGPNVVGRGTGARRGTSRKRFDDVSATVTGTAARTLREKCRQAQMSRLGSGLGQPSPGHPGYQAAINNAVSAMDEAAAQCRASGTSPVAGGTDVPSSETSPVAGGADVPPSGTTTEEQEKENKSFGEVMVAWFNLSKGPAEIIISVAEAGEKPAMAVAQVIGGVVSIVGTATGLIAEGETAHTAETAAHVGEVAGGVLGVVTLAGGAAVAFDAVLPATAVGMGVYAAIELLPPLQSGESIGLVEFLGNGLTGRKYDGSPPNGEQPNPDGTPSCSELQKSWGRFKAYCSQRGNNWKTYDCAVFVAKMNGCADPAIMDVGPEGDYVCTAKCKGGIAGIVSGGGCVADNKIAACEYQRELGGRVSQPGLGSEARRPSCRAVIETFSGVSAMLSAAIRKKICEQANPDFCDPSNVPLPSPDDRPGPVGPP